MLLIIKQLRESGGFEGSSVTGLVQTLELSKLKGSWLVVTSRQFWEIT